MSHKTGFAALIIALTVVLSSCAITQPSDLPENKTPAATDSGNGNGATTPPAQTETGNTQTSAPNGDIGADKDYAQENRALAGLLPQKAGYLWRYFGYAEYGHTMTLDSITQDNGSTIYGLSGSLDDMSGEASAGSLSIKLEYVVAEGKLIQKTVKGGNMDGHFQSLILIQGPLEKGSEWQQKAVGSDNAAMELNCIIKDVIDDGSKTYVVRYEQKDGDYYEERMIREGCGVVGFTGLFVSGTDKFDIGFSLYDQMSGYPDERNLKMLLPPMSVDLRYNGLAEYGHVVKWDKTITGPDQITYQFSGSYDDGSGIPDKFEVDYILDRKVSTVTEKVVANERNDGERINSIIPGLVILKASLVPGAAWEQDVVIDGQSLTVKASITDVQTAQDDPGAMVYTVRYTVDGISGYFNDTYLEERKFQTGKGMIGFSNLLPGDIGLSGKDLEDPVKVREALANHMFGYGLSFGF